MKAKASTKQKAKEKEFKDIKEFEEKAMQKNRVVQHELAYNQYQMGVERWYFWIYDHLREDLKYEPVKTEDEFLNAEMSSFWGVQAQRLGAQQDKAQQMLLNITGMVKGLFQILHSLRIMDERLEYYKQSEKGDKSAEIALKGIWVDLVEGGAKNPASIYGLATQVGFVTLPDWFFDVTPRSTKDVDNVVNKLEMNAKVKEVLKRKLFQFLAWKQSTHNELTTSKSFHIKYLKQHLNTIKLYVRWVKPYLRTIERLQAQAPWGHPEILTALETATVDLELFCTQFQKHDKNSKVKGKKIKKGDLKKYHPCIRIKFHYRTSPQMLYQQDYQRSAIHVGKAELNFEAFVLSTEQIEQYKKLKDKEDIDLLVAIDESMNVLRDDLEKYLKEADVEAAKESKESKALINVLGGAFDRFTKPLTPLINIGKGFQQLGKAFVPPKSTKKSTKDTWPEKRAKKELQGTVKTTIWVLFENFKKAHGMVAW